MLKAPHYDKQGKFRDVCLWCEKRKCPETHTLEILIYRRNLRTKALRLIQRETGALAESRKAYRETVTPINALAEFLALPPERMTMDDHWLKGAYLKRLRNGEARLDAWENAKIDARNVRRNVKGYWTIK